jgi:hypothetical protein
MDEQARQEQRCQRRPDHHLASPAATEIGRYDRGHHAIDEAGRRLLPEG